MVFWLLRVRIQKLRFGIALIFGTQTLSKLAAFMQLKNLMAFSSAKWAARTYSNYCSKFELQIVRTTSISHWELLFVRAFYWSLKLRAGLDLLNLLPGRCSTLSTVAQLQFGSKLLVAILRTPKRQSNKLSLLSTLWFCWTRRVRFRTLQCLRHTDQEHWR